MYTKNQIEQQAATVKAVFYYRRHIFFWE